MDKTSKTGYFMVCDTFPGETSPGIIHCEGRMHRVDADRIANQMRVVGMNPTIIEAK